MRSRTLAVVGSVVLLGACASVPDVDYSNLQNDLQQRAGLTEEVQLDQDRAQARQLVDSLLDDTLEAKAVRRLALLNSPDLHGELARLGIAEADRVQAGLIRNPVFGIGAMRPDGGGTWKLDFGLSQSLLDLFTRSLRTQVAETRLREVQLDVNRTVSEAILMAERAYFEAVAARHKAAMADTLAAAADVRRDLASRFYAAGNITDQQMTRERKAAAQARLVADTAKVDAERARWALATHLGIRDGGRLKLPEQLQRLPQEQFQADIMVIKALNNRLDLQLVRQLAERYRGERAVSGRTRGLDTLDIGVNAEREFDSSWNFGPELGFSLPIFHQGQASVASAEARLAQSDHRTGALELAVEHQVRRALLLLMRERQAAERLEQQIIPLQRRLVELSLEGYNFMINDVFETLGYRQEEFRLASDHVDAVAAYWLGRSALSLAVGGGLPDARSERMQPLKTDAAAGAHGGHGGHDTAPEQTPSTNAGHNDHQHH